ncbi:hypothetical protein L208DRAFT_1376532 [Tricholoma matsutake]|nr:hypothetical protein L208DRAFT_1376532 [Tricholoma matsutake 945]
MAAVQERLLANGESKGILYMTLFAKCRSSADIPDPMLHHTASPAVIQTNAMIPVTPHIPTVLSGNTSALSANTNVQAHVLKFQRQSAGCKSNSCQLLPLFSATSHSCSFNIVKDFTWRCWWAEVASIYVVVQL